MNAAYEEQAKQFAMVDGGLTEFEAEQAVADFLPAICGDYCQDCGCKLIDGKNCNDSIYDDFCYKCWRKYEKQLASMNK